MKNKNNNEYLTFNKAFNKVSDFKCVSSSEVNLEERSDRSSLYRDRDKYAEIFNQSSLNNDESIFNQVKNLIQQNSGLDVVTQFMEGLVFSKVDFYSFINFTRYYWELNKFFRNDPILNCNERGIISIILKGRKSDNNMDLQLVFQRDGIVKFLSLDRDSESDDSEKMLYVIEGNFSSSNLIEKNYKIERLLRILGENHYRDSEKDSMKSSENYKTVIIKYSGDFKL